MWLPSPDSISKQAQQRKTAIDVLYIILGQNGYALWVLVCIVETICRLNTRTTTSCATKEADRLPHKFLQLFVFFRRDVEERYKLNQDTTLQVLLFSVCCSFRLLLACWGSLGRSCS